MRFWCRSHSELFVALTMAFTQEHIHQNSNEDYSCDYSAHHDGHDPLGVVSPTLHLCNNRKNYKTFTHSASIYTYLHYIMRCRWCTSCAYSVNFRIFNLKVFWEKQDDFRCEYSLHPWLYVTCIFSITTNDVLQMCVEKYHPWWRSKLRGVSLYIQLTQLPLACCMNLKSGLERNQPQPCFSLLHTIIYMLVVLLN